MLNIDLNKQLNSLTIYSVKLCVVSQVSVLRESLECFLDPSGLYLSRVQVLSLLHIHSSPGF